MDNNDYFKTTGKLVDNGVENVDPSLLDILHKAANGMGVQVQAFSGYRPGDRRAHGSGSAVDVRIIDPQSGQPLANYQDPQTFSAYEQLAQAARAVQQRDYPGHDQAFRWGGYFSGPPGKYGAMDTMHFDLAGKPGLGMAGGSWDGGLTENQKALFPGVQSAGMKGGAAPMAFAANDGGGKKAPASQAEFLKAWGVDLGGGAPATPAAQTKAAPAGAAPANDQGQFLKAWGVDASQLDSKAPAGQPAAPDGKGKWGWSDSVLNGIELGYGPQVEGAIQAANPWSAPGTYARVRDQLTAARTAYNQQNPIAGAVAEGAGTIAPTVLGGALAGTVIKGGAALVTQAAPALEALAPVGRFLAGNAGQGAGVANKLLRGGSLATSGAIQGAAAGAAASHLNDGTVGQQAETGALLGAGLGVAGPVVAAGARGAYNFGKSLVQPFTQGGRETIVNNFIGDMGKGGNMIADTTAHVPGSQPTLAQATANPGIATLERSVRDVRPVPFTELETANKLARNEAFGAVRGDALSLEGHAAARNTEAIGMEKAAFANAKPTDPAPVLAKIEEILQSRSGQSDDVVKALTGIKKKIVTGTREMPDGSTMPIIETDPNQLYGIRQHLTKILSPAARGTTSDAQLAAKELMQVKKVLDDVIETGAPGYKAYLQKFRDMSVPINTEKLLQKANPFDTKGDVTLGGINRLITSIDKGRMAGGANDAKTMPPEIYNALTSIREDMRRGTNSALGKSMGSDSVQRLATHNIAMKSGLPLAALSFLQNSKLGIVAGYVINKAYSGQNTALLDTLTNRLMTPSSVNLPSIAAMQGRKNVNMPPWLVPAGAAAGNRLMAVPPSAQK